MKNLLFILLIAASLFLAIFFYWKYTETRKEQNLSSQRINDRDTQIYKQNKLIDSLKTRTMGTSGAAEADTIELVTPPSARFMDELGSLSSADVARLEKKGLRNPEVDLKNSLMRNQQTLIPAKGTMGGTMTIRDIRILTDQYALAYFEDGHNGGHMLLKYTVAAGNVTWRVLDSTTL